jgi:hypothetical protein
MNPPSKIDQNRENQRNQFSSSPNPIPPGLAVFVFPRVPDAPNKNTSGTHRELCCESTLQTQIITFGTITARGGAITQNIVRTSQALPHLVRVPTE